MKTAVKLLLKEDKKSRLMGCVLLATVGCGVYHTVVSQLTVLGNRERLLPDFGRIVQNKRHEEDKDRRSWNNQVSFSLFFFTLFDISAQTLAVYIELSYRSGP